MARPSNATVVLRDGARGTVDAWRTEGETLYALVRVEERVVWVDAQALALQADGVYALPVTRAELAQPVAVVPVMEEAVRVHRRVVEAGTVRLRKVVTTREEVVAPTITREVIDVQRVPVDRVVEAPVAPRQEGDTLVVPVLEETLVVVKRLRVVEELRVTVRREESVAAPQRVSLRREEVVVERDAPAEAAARGRS